MEAALRALAGVFLFFFGAAVFSFLGVVIDRLPRGEDYVRGHSVCPACGRRLTGRDLVPVLSWLWLRGRCRTCGARIPVRCLCLELLGGGAALGLAGRYGLNAEGGTVFLFFCVLTCVAFVDADTMEIPNGFILWALAAAALAAVTMPGLSLPARLLGGVCVSVPMLLLALAVPGAFGGGDIKLMAACGLFLGWRLTVTSMFLALLGGGGYALYLLARKRAGRKTHFSFGPFLCLGMAAAQLWGERLIGLYLGSFGL